MEFPKGEHFNYRLPIHRQYIPGATPAPSTCAFATIVRPHAICLSSLYIKPILSTLASSNGITVQRLDGALQIGNYERQRLTGLQ